MFTVLLCGTPLIALVVVVAIATSKLKGVGGRGTALLLATWLLDLPACFARSVVGFILSGFIIGPVVSILFFLLALLNIVLSLAGAGERTFLTFNIGAMSGIMIVTGFLATATGAFIGFGPLIWSILTAFGLWGGKYRSTWEMGARRLSRREIGWCMKHLNALAIIKPKMKLPNDVYALDRQDERAIAIGSTLIITKGALHGDNLKAILAQAIGQFNSPEARIRLALRRLPTPLMHVLARATRTSAPGAILEQAMTSYGGVAFSWILNGWISLLSGGFGIWVLQIPWAAWFREQQYTADAFAKDLGERVALRNYLSKYEFMDTAVPYLASPEPYVELRLERLEETTVLPTGKQLVKSMPVK